MINPLEIAEKLFKMPRRCVMMNECASEPNKQEYLLVYEFRADSDRWKGRTKVVQIARRISVNLLLEIKT